jgi:hypothetical protein
MPASQLHRLHESTRTEIAKRLKPTTLWAGARDLPNAAAFGGRHLEGDTSDFPLRGQCGLSTFKTEHDRPLHFLSSSFCIINIENSQQ